MKKVVVFLLCVLIFVTPVTTFVKADVVIGDNNESIINENATILGRKLALMESLSDLALSGVTEFTISNTNDVDSYLDSLWSEVNDAIEYLDSGQWTNDINNQLASKYFTNLVQYKDYINNRGDYFAHLLPSGNPTSSLLSTFFANNLFGKHSTLHNNLSLDTFRALSRVNSGNIPDVPNEYASIVDDINGSGFNFITQTDWTWSYSSGKRWASNPQNSVSWYVAYSIPDGSTPTDYKQSDFNNWNRTLKTSDTNTIDNINIYTDNGYYTCVIECDAFIHSTAHNYYFSCTDGNYNYWSNVGYWWWSYQGMTGGGQQENPQNTWVTKSFTTQTLTDMLYNIRAWCRNVNIYVDGQPFALASYVPTSPTLDIDGFLKLYDDDIPQQYELQPNTQIDYDQLYQVIYNAIRDNLPISQGDINYYDSHDTIYSPTIINNYGEEEGDESDLIDTILDYAVIPKFDTAIAQPMRAALTNGVIIMNNSITNVIPNEILLILGACFFLLLFAVVINRMIK